MHSCYATCLRAMPMPVPAYPVPQRRLAEEEAQLAQQTASLDVLQQMAEEAQGRLAEDGVDQVRGCMG